MSRFLAATALLLGLTASGVWWWSGSEGSLATALRWVSQSSLLPAPLSLTAQDVTGSLRHGGRVERLVWQDAGLYVTASQLEVRWQALALLSGRLQIDRLHLARLQVDPIETAETPPTTPPSSLRLPLDVMLEDLAVGRISWGDEAATQATDLRAHYRYANTQHALTLKQVQVASGHYEGRVSLAADGAMTLDASLTGVLKAALPNSKEPLSLRLNASAQGALTAFTLNAALDLNGTSPRSDLQPQASINAHISPWAAQPVPEAKATFRDLDLALLLPQAPHTQLTGKAQLVPQETASWTLQATLKNSRAGPWDQQRLPVDQLQAKGEWRGGQVLLRSMDAQLGGGRLQASGEWTDTTNAKSTSPDWRVNLQLQQVNPAALYSKLTPLRMNGSAALKSTGDTLELSALQLRTRDAEIKASGQYQPKTLGGQGQLSLTAPGIQLETKGELRPSTGSGQLAVTASDLQPALRWLRGLPGLAPPLEVVTATGRGQLSVDWQGGWRDPQLSASLNVPTLDWQPTSTKLRLRDVQASLKGRLSQMQVTAKGRADIGTRRIALELGAEGGSTAKPLSLTSPLPAWQASVKQLKLSVEDPALGSGAWRIETQRPFNLTGAADLIEVGAGQASLSAPAATNGNRSAATSSALLAWQPTRWQADEVVTAGSLKGLPLAWAELLLGPQIASAGLIGNLLFDGEWDLVIGPTLKLTAQLARSSGDLTLQAETADGVPARVAAGIREARLNLAINNSSEGAALIAQLRWDSARAGSAEGELRTQLRRTAAGTIAGWSWPADAALSGQLKAQLPRLGAWSVLAPPGWRLRGSLATEMTLSGNRLAPQFKGDLQADDLALRSVVDGFEFGQGRLRANVDGTRMRISEFSLRGAGANDAGGQLRAEGEASWLNGAPQVTLTAQLDRLRASIRNDRQITLSGQLQASLTDLAANISGALNVDQARIVLPDESRPQLGDDVRVKTAPLAQANRPAASTAKPPTRVTKIDVQLNLGNDFRIQGKGINTRMRGSLNLLGNSVSAPRLLGTIATAGGEYSAYGQRLDIETGVLRFTGPIDNPTLNILAIRPNLSQRVGVEITGTALLPNVRLYAQPDLPEAEKLAWLILGRSSAAGGAEAALLQQAALALLGSKSGSMTGGLASSLGLDELSFRAPSSSGDTSSAAGGAITLGKRFSRNFYAAYERSLSGTVGTLFMFYELSRRFTVRAQAGEQTAIDLIFTVPYE
ncbi:MAG: translocation/assembly module TamB domain-containing protein [Polaromonas sp.]|nr:translocation/assembly module TamB domain-containing protein [Polaromonas sp.]